MRRPWPLGVSLAGAIVVSTLGCNEARPRTPARPRPDKAALYGDPGLVPTREGEHVRRELARAGEIEAAVALLDGVGDARVDVELDARGALERALVVVRHDPAIASTRITAEAQTIVSAVLGPEAWPAVRIVLVPSAAVPERSRLRHDPAFLLLLSFAAIGLGASLGIAIERVRPRPRRRRDPPRT